MPETRSEKPPVTKSRSCAARTGELEEAVAKPRRLQERYRSIAEHPYSGLETERSLNFLCSCSGFPVEVEQPEMGRTITYPGAPYKFNKSPRRMSRHPPTLGEHNDG